MKSNSGTGLRPCKRRPVLVYTGVTNNIIHRVQQHKCKEHPGFTAQYDVNRLVYYEMFGDVRVAIGREKEIKGWTRKKKIALIQSQNPKWEDLSERWGKPLPKQKWQVRDPIADE